MVHTGIRKRAGDDEFAKAYHLYKDNVQTVQTFRQEITATLEVTQGWSFLSIF